MPTGTRPQRRAAKKNAKKLNASRGKAVSKRFGKTVMKSTSSTRSVGYASTAKTKLPKMGTRKVGKGASSQAKRASRRR